ncbi:hypothetical protein E2C01_059953 [Portunus trituberculatus]|uniref:Uncharacterized protein n=1 Tax=Portunus trituberculatus TaxID=210409 RepID=A0A5B7H964_PORTR|nr:hypothetical protein [Portunus trituberculatus]
MECTVQQQQQRQQRGRRRRRRRSKETQGVGDEDKTRVAIDLQQQAAAGEGAGQVGGQGWLPPRSIAISTDYSPRSRLTRVAGPYPEGSEVTLSCQVLGGE